MTVGVGTDRMGDMRYSRRSGVGLGGIENKQSRASAPTPRITRADSASLALYGASGDVLNLQRTIGNRAVTRVLSVQQQVQRTCYASCATGRRCESERTDLDEHTTSAVRALQRAVLAREEEKCEEFPGGSTDCEVDRSGNVTGKVISRVDEKNACTMPCVEKHEAVHVKQMRKLCVELRDCYRAADRGKRPATDCYKLATEKSDKMECEAYNVSVRCMEARLKSRACQGVKNKEYGRRKLKSEKCWRDRACGKP